jgi:outer membrane lipoprotein carrier protein
LKFRITTVLVLLTTLAGHATAAEGELDRAARAMNGMEASFVHRFTAKGFKTSQVERGSVLFGQLPKMRWTYTAPESKVFVFDGTTSWFYVPSEKQVTTSRMTEASKAELPFLLLGDSAARDRHFSVSEKKRGNSVVLTLRPRSGAALVAGVDVTISATTHLIDRIDYADRDGNRTSFEFSGYHRRQASADSFRFVPPAGVQNISTD